MWLESTIDRAKRYPDTKEMLMICFFKKIPSHKKKTEGIIFFEVNEVELVTE